ncbi:MAG: GDP-mannose 4,6-dehydratase, partial [Deltaproteobacteria bacterium]|nr:GDP-mannose 4,6-dehydratase [Deltaproteobacteria bacterium]
DGSQTRSFCYISDMVEGIYGLLYSGEHLPINLGNPDEISVLDFAKEIIALAGSRSRITYKPLPSHDPKVRQPDITKAKTLLGWNPKVSRKEGLSKTVEYFKKKISEALNR